MTSWDHLLLCGLDFRDIKFYIASRKSENLIKKGIITGQGKKKDGVAQLYAGILVFTQRFQK